MPLVWSEAKLLKKSPLFTSKDFAETLDGGQSFRFYRISENTFEGVFGRNVVRLSLNKKGQVLYSYPISLDEKIIKKELLYFLDFQRDYAEIINKTKDKNVIDASKRFPSLRILRQSPHESIICFICSSSKRIIQIKQCVKLLADTLGEPICEGFNALPTFEKIANASDEELRSCKLGYRANYLKKTSQKIISDKFDPNNLLTMPYPDAKKYLLSLTGVGEKVADCILLFGASKFEAFPVDTWISKAMADLYKLESPKQARLFASKKFGSNAGYIQQILFAKIRERTP